MPRTRFRDRLRDASTLSDAELLRPGTLRGLQQERDELTTRARGLVDTAESESRGLTTAEEQNFDGLMADAEALGEQIDRAIHLRERERRDGAGDRDTSQPPPLTLRMDDGREVPAVGRGRSFAEAVGDDAPGERANLIGRAVLQYATGRQMLTEGERDLLNTAVGPSGGYLLMPSMSSQLVDLIRNVTVLDRAGAQFFPMDTNEVRLVKVATDPAASWRDEHEEVASTDLELGMVELRSKSIAAMVTLSEELAEDAPNAPQAVEQTLAEAVAVELDGRLFRGGTETPSPMAGVLDTEGVGSVDLAGANPTDYDPWLDAIEQVEQSNIVPNVRIDSPRTKAQLAKLKVAVDDNRQLPAPAEVAELRHIVSNQVPTNLGAGTNQSVSVVGNFGRAGAMVLVGVRRQFRIDGTRVGAGAFEKLQVKLRISGRYDVAVIRPAGLIKVAAIGPTP